MIQFYGYNLDLGLISESSMFESCHWIQIYFLKIDGLDSKILFLALN